MGADGSLDALELTAGSSLLNPMYLFRGDAPVKEFAAAFRPPQRWGVRAMAEGFDIVAMGRALLKEPGLIEPDRSGGLVTPARGGRGGDRDLAA
ncbi:hypothetical protein ABZW11_38200 [Nonomuraea sp. NPDC004580]|uniref:hypothetical protein n=1 Tax=Nonomuraea sp. NPDC004580 TaxID=3154552 RepID=UPI0033BDBA71